jgi:hypothetical protein
LMTSTPSFRLLCGCNVGRFLWKTSRGRSLRARPSASLIGHASFLPHPSLILACEKPGLDRRPEMNPFVWCNPGRQFRLEWLKALHWKEPGLDQRPRNISICFVNSKFKGRHTRTCAHYTPPCTAARRF